MNMYDIANSPDVKRLAAALVKSGTTKPRTPSKVLPIQPFVMLFRNWPPNEDLDIPRLCMKCIVSLAITLMLRPSDISPRATHFDMTSPESPSPYVFSTNNIQFHPDGSCSITFHGIKQDTDRAGFQVQLPPAIDSKLDPELCATTLKKKKKKQPSTPSQSKACLPCIKPPLSLPLTKCGGIGSQ